MDLVKKLLKQANIRQTDLKEYFGVKSLGTISLKLNRKAPMTVKEALTIKNLINSKLHTDYTIEELFEF